MYDRCLEYCRGQWPTYEKSRMKDRDLVKVKRRGSFYRKLEAEAGKSQSEREGRRQKQGQKRRVKERDRGKEGF
jgi:hypothetical protein